MSANAKMHSMNFGLFYGTFYVEVGNFSRAKLEEKIPLLDILVEEKKIRLFFENWHILIPAFCVVNLHTLFETWARTLTPFQGTSLQPLDPRRMQPPQH